MVKMLCFSAWFFVTIRWFYTKSAFLSKFEFVCVYLCASWSYWSSYSQYTKKNIKIWLFFRCFNPIFAKRHDLLFPSSIFLSVCVHCLVLCNSMPVCWLLRVTVCLYANANSNKRKVHIETKTTTTTHSNDFDSSESNVFHPENWYIKNVNEVNAPKIEQ